MSGVPLVSVFVEGDSTMNIEAQFNLIAEEYDCNRRKFIPCFILDIILFSDIILFREYP